MWVNALRRKDQSMQGWKQAREQAWFFTILSLIALWPDAADASTLGSIICSINGTSKGYVRIVSACCYISGLLAIIRGVLLLKKHSDNPNDTQMIKAIAHLVVGGCLVSFPAFVGVMQRSVFGATAAGAARTCDPKEGAGGAASLDVMMQNFVKNVHGPMFTMISIISILAGLTMIFRGLLRASKTGSDPRASNPKDILAYLLIGAVLVSVGTALPSVMKTIFGSDAISNMSTFSAIQWSKFAGDGVNATAADNTVKAILAFVQIIGAISFLRGWLVLKTAIEGGGQATVPQGVTHIIGGAMAINIDMMLKAIDKTFGTGILSGT